MLEPHATEIRRELVRVRVASLHHAARPSHAGPLRRAVGNAFVRLGLLLGSDGSVRRRSRSPRRQGPSPDARPPEPHPARSRQTARSRASSISPGRPRRRTASESARRSFEGDHAPDPGLQLHQLEPAIHVVQSDPMRDERHRVDLARQPAIDQLRHLRASLHSAERRFP